MPDAPRLLTNDQLKQRYGSFYDDRPWANLDPANVPRPLWSLIPYAELWGDPDDLSRDRRIMRAPEAAKADLGAAMRALGDVLDDWLMGPEADSEFPTDEYVAFTAMVMSALSVPRPG
jgi:hypothetical protein